MPITLAPGAHRLRRAGFLAQTAWDLLQATENKATFDASRLSPIYIKSEEKKPEEPAAPDAEILTGET
ncbi:MAG: hypothetical protein H7X77_11240 [Anaerolineae bacterium]|nr:hypothetical protein [Anaerolineae bacterium]